MQPRSTRILVVWPSDCFALPNYTGQICLSTRTYESMSTSRQEPETVPQPKRSRFWGAVLVGVGLLLLQLCLRPYYFGIGQLSDTIRSNGLSVNIIVIATVLAFGCGCLVAALRVRNRLVDTGRKLMSPDAHELLLRDKRRPIFYLRSFDHDEPATANIRSNAELDMVKAFKKIGPVVAIGKPGEKLQTLGAARTYVGHDWRNVILAMIRKASLVILRPGHSDGFWWEVRQVQETLPPTKIAFYFASSNDVVAFRKHAEAPIEASINLRQGEWAFLTYDECWQPNLLIGTKRNRIGKLRRMATPILTHKP